MITYIPYVDKSYENKYFNQLILLAKEYRLGIISDRLPLISNLAVAENIALPTSFHDNISLKIVEKKIIKELASYNLEHILYLRENQLSTFEKFIVKYITAKFYKTDAIVIFSSLHYLHGKDREDLFIFLNSVNLNKVVIIEETDFRSLINSQINIEEKSFESWVIQNLKV